MNAAEKTDLREGDIFRWRWADPARDQPGDWGPYHCYSRIARVRNGRLFDTYWQASGETEIDPAKVTLEFVANAADLIDLRSGDIPYYRREDVVDLRHANSMRDNVFLRKGAKRDADAMMARLEELREQSNREIRFANERLEQLLRDEMRIAAGETEGIWL